MKKRLLGLFGSLFLAGLILAAQRTYLCVNRLVQAKQRAQLETLRTHEMLAATADQLRAARIRLGEVWAGELCENKDSVDTPDQISGPSVPNPTEQRRIHKELPLGNGEVRVAIELHECNPGSDACTSGGSLQLFRAEGDQILTGSLSLFQDDGKSVYEFNWDNTIWQEEEKIVTLKGAVGDEAPPERDAIYALIRKLYGYDGTPITNPELLTKELIVGILCKALHDRMSM